MPRGGDAAGQPTEGATGHLRLYPARELLPLVSTINYAAGQTRANNGVVALDPGAQVAV